MITWRSRICYTALLATCLATSALAGPPYVTDDPEPTDLHSWEVYGYGASTLSPHARDGTGGFDINYGGAKDLQLSAVISLAYRRLAGAATQVGISDTQFGAKYRFLHQRNGSWVPDAALFPKVEVPTAGRRFGWSRVGLSVPLWLQKDWGPWSLFGGGGWTLNPGRGNRDFGFGGMALTRSVTQSLSLGAEVYHQTADAVDARTSTGLGIGANWQIARRWSIIGSAGPIIQNRTTAGRYAVYAALEFHN